MSVFKREGSPFLWCRFMLNGRRYAQSTGTDKPKLAAKFESDLKGKIMGGLVATAPGKAPKLSDFANQYLVHISRRVEAKSLKESSRESYKAGCVLLSRTRVWNMRLDKISRLVAAELSFPHGAVTANRALKVLHAILSYAEELGILVAVPKINLREEVGRDRLMAPWEQEIILRHAPPVLHDILSIILECGMRPDEVRRMKWMDTDWIENKVLVQRGKSKNARRHVGLTAIMREVLVGRKRRNEKIGLSESPFVFATRRGAAGHTVEISHTWIDTMARVERELQGRGIVLAPGLVPYSARHTYATTFLKAGGDVGQLMRLMGHTDLSMTMRYVHLVDAGASAEVMNKHHENIVEIKKKRA